MADAISSIDEIKLDGRVALVTGAGGGMGKVMARALARAGASVAIVDNNAAKVAATADEIGQETNPGQVIGLVADITGEADCDSAVRETVAAFGKLQILVNNAALAPRHIEAGPRTKSRYFWEMDPDAWQKLIATNVNGTFLMSRAAGPELLKGGWGRIVNITTGLDAFQRRFASPYGTSKAAIESMTQAWSKDVAGTELTVNSLHPGSTVDTDFLTDKSKENIRAEKRLLLDPGVMAAPIVWLCSPLSDGVTGGRFEGMSWDPALAPAVAAEKARQPAIFLPY